MPSYKIDTQKFNETLKTMLDDAQKVESLKTKEDKSAEKLTTAQNEAQTEAAAALTKEAKAKDANAADVEVKDLTAEQQAEANKKGLEKVAKDLNPLFLFEVRVNAAKDAMKIDNTQKDKDGKAIDVVEEKDLETFKKAFADAQAEMVAGYKKLGNPTAAEKAKDIALKIIGAVLVAVTLFVPYFANVGGFKNLMDRTFFSGAQTAESKDAAKVTADLDSPFETVPAPAPK
ncbi:MAG: hypothetical protein P1U32_00635 [Legionellaceae bacterium]|nr:hypothetical protein [Legionellaceae bacterium]